MTTNSTTRDLIPTYLLIDGATVPIIDCGEDELIHTADHPFCPDPSCPCHADPALIREYLSDPLRGGLLTGEGAARTFNGRQF